MPFTLYDDLLTLTKAARLAESDLYTSIQQSCSTGVSEVLDTYKSSIALLVESAIVNDTAVLESAWLALDAAYPTTAQTMKGLILNNGGLRNCKVRTLDISGPWNKFSPLMLDMCHEKSSCCTLQGCRRGFDEENMFVARTTSTCRTWCLQPPSVLPTRLAFIVNLCTVTGRVSGVAVSKHQARLVHRQCW